MKAKKPLVLVAFTLLLVALVVGITGLAFAALPPDNHEAIPVAGNLVTGDVENVDYFLNWAGAYPDESGATSSCPGTGLSTRWTVTCKAPTAWT